jgi:hypothetical protein
MRSPASFTLAALLAFAPATATGQAGLSFEPGTGIGLKVRAATPDLSSDGSFGGAATQAWQMLPASEFALYSGGSEVPRLGLRAGESYTGIVYSRAGWGSSLEMGYTHLTPFAPQRYSLTGQLHASLGEDRALSIGLKYRTYDTDANSRFGQPETTLGNGYSLAGQRFAGYAPSYQVQMSYQYSAAGALGLAVGRELETYTPFGDTPGSGPRQFSLTGQHWLTPSWALSYDILSQDVAAPLRVQGLRLGVRYRF